MKILQGLKSIFKFDITRSELPKFIALSSVMFCVLFNYTVKRDIKEVLIVGRAGAEVIPFLKGLFIVIATFVLMSLYSVMAGYFGERKVFYIVTAAFMAFFGFFCFYLYQKAPSIHPSDEAIELFKGNHPWLSKVIFSVLRPAIIKNWIYVLFYIASEMYGTMNLSVLFWQLANEVVKLSESNRMYPLFGLISNLGLILSGRSIIYIVGKNKVSLDSMGVQLADNAEDSYNALLSLKEKTSTLSLDKILSKIESGFTVNMSEVTKKAEDVINEVQWEKSLPELGVLIMIMTGLMFVLHRVVLAVSAVEIYNEVNKTKGVCLSKILKQFLTMPLVGIKKEDLVTEEVEVDSNKDKKSPSVKKKKPGFFESAKLLFNSKYLLLMAMIVLAYGMSINLFEVIWKKQISLHFQGNPGGQAIFQASVSEKTGIFVILFILLTKDIFSRMSWLTRALVTPMIMLFTGAIFFSFVLANKTHLIQHMSELFGILPVYVAVIAGGAQSVSTKGAKYSMFDTTKENLYIVLDKSEKTNAKVAVDGWMGRISKAFGSWTYLFIYFVYPAAEKNLNLAIPFVGIIIGILIVSWFYSVRSLSVMYKDKKEAYEERERDYGDKNSSK